MRQGPTYRTQHSATYAMTIWYLDTGMRVNGIMSNPRRAPHSLTSSYTMTNRADEEEQKNLLA